MAQGLKRVRRHGVHWDLVREALDTLRTTRFYGKVNKEKELESQMVTQLRNNGTLSRHVLCQLRNDPVEKIEHARMLGFRLRPDAALGRDGTAIELKMVRGATALRDAIGQALVYRADYRFVVLCLVDRTTKGQFSEFAGMPERPGHQLLQSLANDLAIFSVIAPHPKLKQKENIVLISE